MRHMKCVNVKFNTFQIFQLCVFINLHA